MITKVSETVDGGGNEVLPYMTIALRGRGLGKVDIETEVVSV